MKIDFNYCIKADNDSMFDAIRNDVNKLFAKLRDAVIKKCTDMLNELSTSIQKANEIVNTPDRTHDNKFLVRNFSDDISDISRLIERNSYFDGLNAIDKLENKYLKAKEYIKSADNYLVGIISRIESQISKISYDFEKQSHSRRSSTSTFIRVIGVIISIIIGFRSCVGHMENVGHRRPDGISDAFGNLISGTVGTLLIFVLIVGIGSFISVKIGEAIGASFFPNDTSSSEIRKLNVEKTNINELLTKLRKV